MDSKKSILAFIYPIWNALETIHTDCLQSQEQGWLVQSIGHVLRFDQTYNQAQKFIRSRVLLDFCGKYSDSRNPS